MNYRVPWWQAKWPKRCSQTKPPTTGVDPYEAQVKDEATFPVVSIVSASPKRSSARQQGRSYVPFVLNRASCWPV
jgi:hypothetical protein